MLARGDFVPLSLDHLGALAVIGAVAGILAAVLRQAAGRPSAWTIRWRVCVGIAAAMVAGALFKQVYDIATHQWGLQDSLPLHVCDIAVFVTAAALVLAVRGARPAQTLYELAYYWGLGGTVQALLTPDLDEAFPHPVYFRYFLTHGGIVVGVLVLTIGLRMRPRPSSPMRVWLITAGLAAAVFLIDGVLGANYMFLWGRPQHPSIIDFLGPWPWSLLWLVLLATALILLCYSPFWIIDRRRGASTPARRAGRPSHWP